MKFRKKPVVIEAFKYNGDLMGKDGNYYVPNWAIKAYEDGVFFYDNISIDAPPTELFIMTLEGNMHVSIGDYIIQGVKGEIYNCKSDIFEMTYDLVEENSFTKKNTITQEQITNIMENSKIEVITMGLKTTVVSVTLPNGFVIVDSSSCVDAVNYDEEMGKEIVLKRIENKVWELEGYKLQCEMSNK